jgi:hypothetical protein
MQSHDKSTSNVPSPESMLYQSNSLALPHVHGFQEVDEETRGRPEALATKMLFHIAPNEANHAGLLCDEHLCPEAMGRHAWHAYSSTELNHCLSLDGIPAQTTHWSGCWGM